MSQKIAHEVGLEIGHEKQAKILAEWLIDDGRVSEVYCEDERLCDAIEIILRKHLPLPTEVTVTPDDLCPNCKARGVEVQTIIVEGEPHVVCAACREEDIGLARKCSACGNYFEELVESACYDCRQQKELAVPEPGEFACYVCQKIVPEDERSDVDYMGMDLCGKCAVKLGDAGDYKLLKWAYGMGYRYCRKCHSFHERGEFPDDDLVDFVDDLTCHACLGKAKKKKRAAVAKETQA